MLAEDVDPDCADDEEEERHGEVEFGQRDLARRQEASRVLLLDVNLKIQTKTSNTVF